MCLYFSTVIYSDGAYKHYTCLFVYGSLKKTLIFEINHFTSAHTLPWSLLFNLRRTVGSGGGASPSRSSQAGIAVVQKGSASGPRGHALAARH